jgi:hypothetical protein
MAFSAILQNEHFTVDVDPTLKLARISRTAIPFASADQVASKWLEVSRALDRIGRRQLAQLVDLRAAPGRNEPEFEAAMLRVRPMVMRDFRRIGILVQSTVGAMQIKRHVREDGIERMISSSEAELLAYLCPQGAS